MDGSTVAEVWLGSAPQTAGGLTSAQSHPCLLPSPGCTVQGPGGQPGGQSWGSYRLLACWPLPHLETPALRGPDGWQTHLTQNGWSHLVESSAHVTGNLWPQWQEAGGRASSWAGIGDQSPAPPLCSRASCGVSSHPLWCCRSLWMVLKLRKKLRSPMEAFTRYVWGFVQEKGWLPLL